MRIPYYENMTNSMKAVVDFTMDEKRLMEDYTYCLAKYREAEKASRISLPAKTEDGTSVVHGARMICDRAAGYWRDRLNAAWDLFSEEMKMKIRETEDMRV